MNNMDIEKIKLDEIIPSKYNPRVMSEKESEKLSKNLREFGLVDPIIINLKNNHIIGGHQRYNILKNRAGSDVDYENKEFNLIRLGDVGWVFDDDNLHIKDEKHEKALNLALNKISGEWDFGKLDLLLDELENDNFDIDLTGFEITSPVLKMETHEKELIEQPNSNSPRGENMGKIYGTEKDMLVKDFIVPPFSILSTRRGYWAERKKQWLEKIGDYGQSRENLISHFGVSIFDPVLAEVILTWFLPTHKKCHVCDPFSGDSIIGYVSTYLGHIFIGTELRKEQADLNNERISKLNSDSIYFCDDGRNLHNYLHTEQDLIFSCPPYYNLEKYSDLENDASNQETYEEFYSILDEAYSKTIPLLRDNRFAVVVVGDIRNKQGFEYDFPASIISTFQNNGMKLYNRIVLETPLGTAPMRARTIFKRRKITKVHQVVLVFYKGNPLNIDNEFGEIDIGLVDESDG